MGGYQYLLYTIIKKKNTHYQLSLNIISIDILNPSIPRRCPRVSPRSPALLRPVAAASGHRGAARGNGPARLRPEERRHGLGMSTIHEQSIAPVLYDWMDTTIYVVILFTMMKSG